MGNASICHSCQQDVLKQDYQDLIFCPHCKTEWKSTYAKHKKVAAVESMGMPCYACNQGLLTQQYGNIITCNSCGTQWRAWKMKGYSKRQRFKQELSMIG